MTAFGEEDRLLRLERIEAAEKDRLEHCRTCFVSTMSADQFRALVRESIRDEIGGIGLPISTPEERKAALLDFTFTRSFRTTMSAAATSVGYTVIVTGFAALATVGGAAVTYFKSKGG